MQLGGLNHVTINCSEADLAAERDFLIRALGLVEGKRPNFAFPGHWLYLDGQPVIHLAARESIAPGTKSPTRGGAGFDHIAFTAHGLDSARARLDAAGIAYTEAPVPGFPLHQIFLDDPLGQRFELTFRV